MFLIRQSKPEDVATLVKLARTVYFINLPPDDRIIASKIDYSARCVRKVAAMGGTQAPADGKATAPRRSAKGSSAGSGLAAKQEESELFMFSVVDHETGSVVGTSQIRARVGGPGNPNWRMRVGQKKFHAPSLGFGTTHTVAQLDGDESGPTEIGGLILDPGFRGHRLRPGRLISFVRFHFIGLARAIFADTVLAEMMGSVDANGDSLFWDSFGRKFIPVRYAEADRFCQHNRAFISELLPKDEIYLTLLPLEVQNLVGVVGRETLPARRLLEELGFEYRGYIDPFDGGPHLEAQTDDLALVKATRQAEAQRASADDARTVSAIVSTLTRDGEFRATQAWVAMQTRDPASPVRLDEATMELLGAKPGQRVGVTPLGKHGPTMPEQGASPQAVSASTPARASRTKASPARAKARAGRAAKR